MGINGAIPQKVQPMPSRLIHKDSPYPQIPPKNAVEPDYMLPNRHSCFTNAKTLEPLDTVFRNH